MIILIIQFFISIIGFIFDFYHLLESISLLPHEEDRFMCLFILYEAIIWHWNSTRHNQLAFSLWRFVRL